LFEDEDIPQIEEDYGLHKTHAEKQVSEFLPRPDLNVTTDRTSPRILVYNRVPKCGSQTLSMLINQLSRRNGFLSKAVFQVGETPERSPSEQRAFMAELEGYAKDQKVLFTRHQYFINFDTIGWKDQPLYMNLIRDPVDRFVSFYYFSRYGNKRAQDAGRSKQQVPNDLVNESIDDCITRRRRECIEPIWHTVPYICGNDKICMKRHEASVQQAKQNIDSKYIVVGILEQLNATLKVLEAILPDFFAGAVAQLDAIRNDTYTVNKKKLSDAAREYLQQDTSLSLEYDLYNHAKTRLFEQMRRLNIEADEPKY